jgi:acyl carrier protein
MDIANQVRDYIIDNFIYNSRETELKNQDSFLKKGILDSTGILELITFLENTYGILVEDEELVPENLDSLDNVSKFVSYKLGNTN